MVRPTPKTGDDSKISTPRWNAARRLPVEDGAPTCCAGSTSGLDCIPVKYLNSRFRAKRKTCWTCMCPSSRKREILLRPLVFRFGDETNFFRFLHTLCRLGFGRILTQKYRMFCREVCRTHQRFVRAIRFPAHVALHGTGA